MYLKNKAIPKGSLRRGSGIREPDSGLLIMSCTSLFVERNLSISLTIAPVYISSSYLIILCAVFIEAIKPTSIG